MRPAPLLALALGALTLLAAPETRAEPKAARPKTEAPPPAAPPAPAPAAAETPATPAAPATPEPGTPSAQPTEPASPETPAVPETPATPGTPAQNPAPTPGPAPDVPITWRAPTGEAPPLPFPVVLSIGPGFAPRLAVGDFTVEPHLRIWLRGAWIQEDPDVYFIGRNSGFSLAYARAGVSGTYRNAVKYSLSLEGAADRRSELNQLSGELSTRLRDAYVTFLPWTFLQLTAGQFRPPSDRESLTSLDQALGSSRFGVWQLLPEMSVSTRGVAAGEGLQVRGLDPGRDIGVMVHGYVDPWNMVNASYAFALVNGNGENQVLNDNNEPVVWGRLTAGVHGLPVLNLAEVGTSLHYGRTTSLTALPNVFNDQVLGGEVDGTLQLFGFEVMAQGQWLQTRHFTTGAPTELSLGGMVQLAYRDFFGMSPVARAAYYQPSSALPQLTVAEFTAGIRYDLPNVPLAISFAYTHPEETGWGVYDLRDEKPSASEAGMLPGAPKAARSPLGISDWRVDKQDGRPLQNERLEAVMELTF